MSKQVEITTSAAAAMFVALGFATATGWDRKRLQSRVDQVPTKVSEAKIEALKDTDAKATANAILAAAAADKEVLVVDGAAAKPKATKAKAAAKPKATKAKATKAKATKAKAAAKPKAEAKAKDKFGSRLGSQAAAINAAITRKWQTRAEIAEAVSLGLPRVNLHIRWLVTNTELVVVGDKGVKLA